MKRTSTAIGFWFFNFSFAYLKRLQSSEPLNTKMNPTPCLFRSRFGQNPFFLLLSRFYLLKKKPQRVALVWFGLLDVGIFYSRTVIQRTIVDFPAFLDHGSAEKIAVCSHANHDPNKQEVGFMIEWSGSEIWSFFKYSLLKLKNLKPIAVDDFQGLSIVSYDTTLMQAGRYL
jgi:hypothetical protein